MIKVYSSPYCHWCKVTKEFLKEHNFEFEEIDVGSDKAAQKEVFLKSKGTSIPVVDIDGKIIVGYNEQKLRKALKIK